MWLPKHKRRPAQPPRFADASPKTMPTPRAERGSPLEGADGARDAQASGARHAWVGGGDRT